MSGFNLFVGFIDKGGIINWVITSMYLIWFSIFVERIVFYLLTMQNGKKYIKSLNFIKNELTTDSLKNSSVYKKKTFGFLNNLLISYLENKDKGETKLINELEEAGDKAVSKSERWLWVLSETGHVAPLLGLLGTIVGLIKAFAKIAEIGSGAEVADLAAGIWEAMLTTANGLILAIVAFLSHRIFTQIVQKRQKEMSYLVAFCNRHFGINLKNTTVDNSKDTSNSNDEGLDDKIW